MLSERRRLLLLGDEPMVNFISQHLIDRLRYLEITTLEHQDYALQP